jgi:hypothetical protein
MQVIMYGFLGRRENVALQLPFIYRILDENPNVEYHGWDLCRDPKDSKYLRSLPKRERFHIRTEFYEGNGRAMHGQNRVWRHYTSPEYKDCVFVKTDDDDLFFETDAFGEFVQSAVDNPDHVVSALVVNNGACSRHIPGIWDIFTDLEPSLPEDATPHPELAHLLAVHRSAEYADCCHRWFHTNWRELIAQPPQLIPCQDWLSINALAMSWEISRRVSSLIGTRHPRVVAGRTFHPRNRVGDEGAANMLPRLINTGFVVGHLNFGPQLQAMDPALLTELRKLYADIGAQYLKQ